MNQPYNAQAQNNQAPQAQAPRTVNGITQPLDPMGGGPNIFDMMNSQSAPNSNAPVATDPNGLPPGTQGFPNSSAGSPQGGSPMDKWFKSADNGTSDPATPAAPAAPETPFESIFARTKIDEYNALVKGKDFVGELFNADVQAQFTSGDFSALPSIINAAVQQGAGLSSFLSSRVADKAVNGMFENFQNKSLPELINNHQMNNMWSTPEYADFSKPEMQPMVQMATSHIRSMFPNASAQEVQQKALEMMQDYSSQMGNMQFAPRNQQQQMEQPADSLSDMEKLFNY